MIFKVLGTEASLPTTTGTATSFSEARRVRLLNVSGASREVTVVATQSGDVIGKFTLPPTNAAGGEGVIIDKEYSECLFASGANVKGVKVGFVGY
tara:strand:+ start:200 stop:484 length:285 start_codon:yes stop_codon:yes gene_type:complete